MLCPFFFCKIILIVLQSVNHSGSCSKLTPLCKFDYEYEFDYEYDFLEIFRFDYEYEFDYEYDFLEIFRFDYEYEFDYEYDFLEIFRLDYKYEFDYENDFLEIFRFDYEYEFDYEYDSLAVELVMLTTKSSVIILAVNRRTPTIFDQRTSSVNNLVAPKVKVVLNVKSQGF